MCYSHLKLCKPQLHYMESFHPLPLMMGQNPAKFECAHEASSKGIGHLLEVEQQLSFSTAAALIRLKSSCNFCELLSSDKLCHVSGG